MPNKDKDPPSDVKVEEKEQQPKNEVNKASEKGKKELPQQVETLQKKIKKKDQVISVLEKENEVLKREAKEKDHKIADLKESVLNLELMLNKAQRDTKREPKVQKKNKTLDYFIP